ncbi:CD109 antigen-like [Oscarella lobularis]|uniref:CD109 antigen-like n=1 Tax=Oscarella lobularis TaxID=121494 RepID=UPI0033138567
MASGRAFICLLGLFTVAAAKNSYLIIAPKTVRPGLSARVAVSIFQAKSAVTVEIRLTATSVDSTLASTSVDVQPNADATVDFQMPAQLPGSYGTYMLKVSGSGGLTFSNSTAVTVDSKCRSLFVQTDKGIYKPGQTVRMRLIGYDRDLKPFTEKVEVKISDPNGNLMANWVNVQITDGIALRDFPLSTEPPVGTWKIEVKGDCVDQSQNFEVDKYVLPKFKVTISPPSYIVATQKIVSGSVSAEYTYGKPVKGSAVLNFYLPNQYYSNMYKDDDFQFPTYSVSLPNFDGQASFAVPSANIISLMESSSSEKQQNTFPSSGQLAINASVTEEATGKTLHDQAVASFYNNPIVLKFHESTPSTYKPGLLFAARVVATHPDNTPVADSENLKVNVTITIRNSTSWRFRSSNPKPELYAVRQGIAEILVNIPLDTKYFHMQASYQSKSMAWPTYAYMNSLSQMKSPSNSYIQLTTRSASATAESNANYLVSATFPMSKLYYKVLARGNLVSQSTYDLVSPADRTTLSVAVTAEMAPSARLVVYAIRGDGEVVVDSLTLTVDGLFKNKVTLDFSEEEAGTGNNVDLRVTASPQSYVGLLAIDQSVTLLADGNDITQSSVTDEINTYDPATPNWCNGPIWFGRRRRSICWPYYSSGQDAFRIFKNAGLVSMSDANIYWDGTQDYDYFFRGGVEYFDGGDLAFAAPFGGGGGGAAPPSGSQELITPERVRTFFPETWLWTNATTDGSGAATLNSIVPDTITSWVASAFAINGQTGLGVPSSTASLRAFKPFFVSLGLPYSVIRGEQLALQVVVFNYLETALNVRITLEAKSGISGVFDDLESALNAASDPTFTMSDSVMVPADDSVAVYFAVIPTKIGRIPIKVTAQSTSAADAVERQLLVEPEGRKLEYTRNLFIRLDNSANQLQENLLLVVPPDSVDGSSKAAVTIIGDLMGPTLNNLERMVRLPTGCGEQNAASFAPNIYVREYLVAIRKLSNELEHKTDKYMMTGYQRELNYKHSDGSYSAWGERDTIGSLWLTAFVIKLYAQSSRYIAIDPNQETTSLTWIVRQQSGDGHFDKVGKIVDRYILGGLEGDVARTAFVLISLIEAKNAEALPTPVTVDSAITKARSFLERHLATLTDAYSIPITAYALIFSGSSKASEAKTKLMSAAINKNGATHWTNAADSDDKGDNSNEWFYYPSHAPAADIEMTGYALLALTQLQDIQEGLSVARWLSQQRNSLGGWSSTQDTVIALQAMSSFARLTHGSGQDLTVTLKSLVDSTFAHTFAVNNVNSLVLQQVENVPVGGSLSVAASGNGTALLQASVSYHVDEHKPTKPAYDFTVEVIETDGGSTLTIKLCSKYNLDKESGMVVVSGTLPSGFVADTDKLDEFFENPTTGIQRYEMNDNRVELYLDEISTGTMKCLEIPAVRQYDVGQLQPVNAEVFSYYEPDLEKVSHLYVPDGLADVHVCDLCKCHDSSECKGCDGYISAKPCPVKQTGGAGAVFASILSCVCVLFSLFLA